MKIYNNMTEFADNAPTDGEVYIFIDHAEMANNIYVEIAGDRNVAGFFDIKDAKEYAEFLQQKEREGKDGRK